MLDSVVQMYVGHQMLSTAGMELCNHQKFRILAQEVLQLRVIFLALLGFKIDDFLEGSTWLKCST